MKLNRNPFLCGVLACIIFLAGCSPHRIQTDPTKPPQAISTQEQLNYNNAQVSIHNRAVAKGIIAAYQSGFMEKEYFDALSREQINITRAHKELTPLLKDLSSAASNAAKIKAITDKIAGSAGVLSAAAGVKNPQAKAAIQLEAQLVSSAAASIISTLQIAGVKGF